MRFLEMPGLPRARVRSCALASGHPYIARALERRGIRVLTVAPHPDLPGPVAAHADLQLHDLGGGRMITAQRCESLQKELEAWGFSVRTASLPLQDCYPGDIALCCFALRGRLYCRPDHTAPEILAQYPDRQPVRQGYARCSVCVVDSESVITADRGIAAAAERGGLQVLRIRPGHIRLPGYDSGFLGGCAGLLDPHILAFTGDLRRHPDGREIARFCRDRGVEPLCLCGGELLDVGGLLPLQQEKGGRFGAKDCEEAIS